MAWNAASPHLRPFLLHHETSATLNAPVEAVFSYLDDFRKLSAHMERPSAMMMGSAMAIEMDERGGKAVGSRVRMRGRMLGMPLELNEVVIEREPPRSKAWETIEAKLIVIGQYRLGFTLQPQGNASKLRVFIDYDFPQGFFGRGLGRLFGGMYARWCTQRMASDALRYFSQKHPDPSRGRA